MAELRDARRSKRIAPRPSSWLLDLEGEETTEPVIDPYGGRLFGDQPLFDDFEDLDPDSAGYSSGLFDF